MEVGNITKAATLKSFLILSFLYLKHTVTFFVAVFFNICRRQTLTDNFWGLDRLVFSRFFYIRGNLGNVKEKPTRKTCFSREIKRLALRIYLAKFC